MLEEDTLNPEGTVEDTSSPEEKEQILEDAEKQPIDVDDGGAEKEAEEKKEAAKGMWYDGLGPDIVNDPDVNKYKSLDEYIKGNREVRKMIGKDKVIIPNEKASPEEKAAFYKKLGRPDEPSGYKDPIMEIPEEIAPHETELETFKAKAHELGLTKHQYEEMYRLQQETHMGRLKEKTAEVSQLKTKTETALRKEWGAAYDAKVDGAQRVIDAFFKGQNLHPAFGILANDTGFVRGMAAIADKVGEDAIAGGTRQTMTPEEAQKELVSLQSGRHDLSKAFFDELNPEHKAAVEKSITLQQLAEAGNR